MQGSDFPLDFKIYAVKSHIHNLEAQLTALHPPILPGNPTATQFQQRLKSTQASLHDSQRWVEAFSNMRDYNFTLWTHLQTPVEVSTIKDQVCVKELEVTQQMRDQVRAEIAAKTKEITASQDKQHTMAEMITSMENKALVWFT
jgi:hypothetical protein